LYGSEIKDYQKHLSFVYKDQCLDQIDELCYSGEISDHFADEMIKECDDFDGFLEMYDISETEKFGGFVPMFIFYVLGTYGVLLDGIIGNNDAEPYEVDEWYEERFAIIVEEKRIKLEKERQESEERRLINDLKNKPTTLYYIKIFNAFYKIGITSRNVKTRFAGELHKIKVINETIFSNRSQALNKERQIKIENKQFRYYGIQLLKRTGNTEIFTKDILNLDN